MALVALWSRLAASSLAKNRESQNKLIEMRQIRGNFRICTRAERRAPSARAVTADAEQKKRDLAQKAKTMKKPFDT